MKLVVLACLAAVALAAPQNEGREIPQIGILQDERRDDGDGNFQYKFETENGISQSVLGRPGTSGASVIEGSYRFTFPDGTVAEVTFTADENGFLAESPLIPATPPHVLELLRIAEEQRSQGITWDEQGRRLKR